jgi:hypothetical protein
MQTHVTTFLHVPTLPAWPALPTPADQFQAGLMGSERYSKNHPMLASKQCLK